MRLRFKGIVALVVVFFHCKVSANRLSKRQLLQTNDSVLVNSTNNNTTLVPTQNVSSPPVRNETTASNSTTSQTPSTHYTSSTSTPPVSSPPLGDETVSTASTPSQSSSNSHSAHVLIGTTSKTSTSWWDRDSIFAIFVSVAAVVVLALAAVAYSLSSQGQNTPWYYNNANIYNVQQYDYAPVYVSSLTPRG